jgi:hypothetical protein
VTNPVTVRLLRPWIAKEPYHQTPWGKSMSSPMRPAPQHGQLTCPNLNKSLAVLAPVWDRR